MERVIFHCDLNSFYASVELLDYPQLRHLPVAVCGDPSKRHGVILAKNDHAKKFNVTTGQTVWEAKKLCPELQLLPAHGENYRYYSKKVNEIYLDYTDLVEPYGVDESWLDVTGTLHLFGKTPLELAHEIRERTLEELGLSISVGVSYNKIFAKLGSDYKKPNAVTVISSEDFREIVFPLPVEDLLYVGKRAKQTLHKFGIFTIGDLAKSDKELMNLLLGKQGVMIHQYANGLDNAPVDDFLTYTPPKSLGQGLTFSNDLFGEEQVRSGILMLSDHVGLRLRAHGLKCYGVQLTLRDPQFHNISRQTKLDNPTFLGQNIADIAFSLAKDNWSFFNPVRAISVTAISLVPESQAYAQLTLFDQPDEKEEKRTKLALATDEIRAKYGRKSIGFASEPQKKRQNGSIGFSLDETAD